jgi:hypothetical protein
MKDVSSKSAANLWSRGCLVVDKNSMGGYVRALTLGKASYTPSQTYFFPSNTVNPFKVDNIVMGTHEIASCTTTFWSGPR